MKEINLFTKDNYERKLMEEKEINLLLNKYNYERMMMKLSERN